ncbi:RidA family protein [Candidatus Bipolaricaulota bacterium]|nr:RidA family protein [Candidatus Bipolaricaulota bacterium]HHR85958.1 RidA family protein [Candidatus Acetothermia bacterium]
MSKETIKTSNAPAAVGPYSQAIRAGDLIFVSGQLPMTSDGSLITDNVAEAAKQSLQNISAVLKAAGASMSDVVKVTVFLEDMADFGAMNEVYKEYFTEPYPARAAVAVKTLPKGAPLEIEAIARI